LSTGKAEARHIATQTRALALSRVAMAIGIITVVLGAPFAFFIRRGITKPVKRIIQGLSKSAGQAGSAVSQVSSADQFLAEVFSEQAVSIEETSSYLEEMASMDKQNADHASQEHNLNRITKDLYAHHEEMNLRAAFEIASTYTMIKQEGEYVDQEAQTVKRTYLDTLEYLVTPHQQLNEFPARIVDAKKINQSSPRGKVNLMTIHQAKGLEFKCVIVPSLNEGILPHVNSLEQLLTSLEEERRLIYVAMTRAMERLIITYRKRQMGQPITVASRFLKELEV
jgi:superfamily I DNA/RNA helicase